ncbi:hypothetical protein T11_17229 [Trichinella zimbabwensis]|uniref:Uncharacterized protein n=1 Tax=Trichinella zimbabwensis TaxID=268475 RepID=A0A0V1GNY9_9BILA|nr:hypothetical protein T11_17229 [Trichinella zimbabwensis]
MLKFKEKSQEEQPSNRRLLCFQKCEVTSKAELSLQWGL